MPIAHSRIQPIAPVSFSMIFIIPPKKVASPLFGPRTRNKRGLSAPFFLLGNVFFFRYTRCRARAGTFKNILCALYFIAIFRVH